MFQLRTENSDGLSYQTSEQATKDNRLFYPHKRSVIWLTELLAECFVSENKLVQFFLLHLWHAILWLGAMKWHIMY